MTLAIVTGAPGWLGTQLVRSLVKGLPDVPSLSASDREVRCLVLPDADAKELEELGVAIVRGDVTDAASLEPLFAGAEGATVFHCAGVIHPTKGVAQLYDVNVEGTRNMVEAAKRAKVRRFIHTSSNSPIGTNPTKDHVFDEAAPYNPYMQYGKTKMMAEEIVTRAHATGEIETVIIRPPWFYGPGQPPRQTLFFEMIRDGKAPIVGPGDNRRSMAYVENICQGLLLCEKVDEAAGQTYWIADRRPYPMNEIIDTIEKVLEEDFSVSCAKKRMKLPGFASEVAWLVDATLQGVGAYHQKIHVLSEMNKTIACSIAKAERELGYDPKVDLGEGMRRSIQWMLDRGEKL
ncbi:MAG: NAD(P)-dependent oxidoreductase [Labilithrix sp.]|nr:NAD(P)-dependent oxidoreductase [Labilithrix sp.]MCW5833351.1 NAD(P)-dependent oxidoreductase [Labilithrix sp.]